MLVIRRMVDRHRSYTGIFLPGEPPRIFPTSDYEHGRILQIYKQDKPYEGIVNDFADDTPWPASDPVPADKPDKPAQPTAAKTPARAPAKASPHPRQKRQPRAQHRQARQ